VFIHKIPDGFGRHQHHHHGENDGDRHDRDMFDQADRRNYRIQRKDDIQERDLNEHHPQAGSGGRGLAALDPLQAVVDFVRGLGHEEQAAADQNQITPGHAVAQDRHPGMGESHDPGNGKQESQARHHGQAQAHLACDGALMLGESTDEDGEKDNVVDPSTISSAVKVPRAIHISGSASQSNISGSIREREGERVAPSCEDV
jgi:hypothetical protein